MLHVCHPDPCQINQRKRRQDQHFQHEALICAHRKRFAEIGVEPPAERKGKRNKRQRAGFICQNRDRHCGQSDGNKLRPGELLFQQYRPQGDAEQRVDIIAQRGIDGLIIGDGPHIDPPVERNQRRGQ